jgi:uncharacterized protein YkwD
MRYLLLFVACLLSAFRSAPTPTFPDYSYFHYDWQAFMSLPAVQAPIDLEQPDYHLLDAAIFFVSNAYRAQHELPLLAFEPALRDMAARHSMAMAKYDFVAHENPWEAPLRTLDQRCEAFRVAATGENVASALVCVWEPGAYYYAQRQADGWQYYTLAGDLITFHSYLSLAQTIVERWYQSPSHRQNLLNPGFQQLGCAVRLHPRQIKAGDMPLAYATQNFSY